MQRWMIRKKCGELEWRYEIAKGKFEQRSV